MTQDELKALVGRAALAHVVRGELVGVGTGSTVNHFIDALAGMKADIRGAVSSSNASTDRLRHHGIPVFEAAEVGALPVYIDGADEIDAQGNMIKGGGAALTREKIVAELAGRFVCIADGSKRVPVLGAFPLPVEVIEMAAPQIARHFAALGGEATLRRRAGGELLRTDNGHPLLDVRGLSINDPPALEAEVNQWPGVVTVGLFARRRASVCLLGTAQGVQTLVF
jgi:ribose 5-phosphate isomerase A